MAVTLTVSQVRQALFRSCGHEPGDGEASSTAIGTIFHRVVGELLRPDSECNVESVLRDSDADLALWKSRLKSHAYDQLLGPLLTRQAGALDGRGLQVTSLWRAVQAACDWFAELWWEITAQGTKTVNQRDWFSAEQPLIREIRRPGWREPVAVVGQADAVLRIPATTTRCVIEYKLGQTSPVLDVGQTALYHLLLNGEHDLGSGSALAIVSFKPARAELTLPAVRVQEAQERLIELIGREAGVDVQKPAPPPVVVTPLPKPANPVPSVPQANAAADVPPAVKPEPALNPPIVSQVSPSNVVPTPSAPPAASPEWVAESMRQLLRTLRQSGAPCREIDTPVVGPTFARLFVFPERGVTARKVSAQAEQLHLHLKLPAPPNVSVVDGKIGIDLPRPDRVSIPYSTLRPALPAADGLTGSSRVPVGVDLSGQWQWIDFASSESAHALVVGTPGSGKSQWLRVAVASLLATNTPETLQLLLIDPKQNAFTFCKGSPFLRRPLVVPGHDDEPISEILQELTAEVVRRSGVMASSNSQSLGEHVRTTGRPLPRIVCVCDEYSDLLDGSGKEERKAIEHEFKRIAQVGRAAGVHLVLATQQPRANVITPAIRSLLPAKVTLRVSSAGESRIALGDDGAERLLGNGDLLYKCIGAAVRLQGAWLPTAEEPARAGAPERVTIAAS